jgi:hypothetical protein
MAGNLDRTLRTVLNESNPNKLPAAGQVAKMGDAFHGGLRYFVGVPDAPTDILALPFPARHLARVFVAAGAVTGEYAVVARGTGALAAGTCRIDHIGNIEFLAADAPTSVEVEYFAYEQDAVTLDIAASAANIVALGNAAGGRNGQLLISATPITPAGAAKVVELRGDAAALGAGDCQLSLDGTQVNFFAGEVAIGDVVRCVFIAEPGVGPAAESVAAKMDDLVDF